MFVSQIRSVVGAHLLKSLFDLLLKLFDLLLYVPDGGCGFRLGHHLFEDVDGLTLGAGDLENFVHGL